jgi:hypothetical protein
VETESAINHGVSSEIVLWVNNPTYVKTIGWSLGLQNGNQWVPTYQQGPFDNSISGNGYRVGLNAYNGSTTPSKSTDYIANTDCIISSTGGTGVSISIKDIAGNSLATGLTALTRERLAIGMRVNFGNYSVAPAVSVFQVSG